MERARPYLKVAALLSTVTLIGAFVAYRAGAFSTPVPSEARGEPQPAADPQTATGSPADQHPAFMYGSKSAPAFLPGETAQAPDGNQPVTLPPEPDKIDNSPTFIGGSKSIILVPPGQIPGLTPSGQSPAPANPPPNAPKP